MARNNQAMGRRREAVGRTQAAGGARQAAERRKNKNPSPAGRGQGEDSFPPASSLQSPACPRRVPRGPRREGVILLVVLILLALFTMMLITFVIATVNTRQSVTLSSRVEQTGDPPSTQLHDAFMQLVRGPRDANSVIGPHSLLEDIYGQNPNPTMVHGVIGSYVDSAPSYLLQNPNGSTSIFRFTASQFNPANGTSTPYGFYNGLVITMLDGVAAGRSSRIVGFYLSSGTSYFQVLSFDGILPSVGDHFLINGRPFSGTGFGFRPAAFVPPFPPNTNVNYTRLLDAVDPTSPNPSDYVNGFQYALLPNPRRGVFSPITNPAANRYLDPAGPGGANEDYDAPDFQNMLLAMRIWGIPPSGSAYQLWTLLPSLHRPDLLNYWNQRWKTQGLGSNDLLTDANPASGSALATQLAAQNLLRKIILRPLPTDHPNFTGGNPYLNASSPLQSPYNPGTPPGDLPLSNLIYGPWDVDNDGDGTPDSIWVDLGMPVQTAQDGRRYKPLFAVLCVDMDGKLNLNAHSNWRHTLPLQLGQPNSPPTRFDPILGPLVSADPSNPQPYFLKVGSGYGPPEISLSQVFEPFRINAGTPLPPTNDLTRLLGGDASNLIDGRYGEVEITSGLVVAPGAGVTNVDDPFSWLRELDYPQILGLGNASGYPYKNYPYLPTTSSFNVPANGNFQINGTYKSDPPIAPGWTTRSAFGTPNDLDGDGMIGLDLRGQPLYIDYPALSQNGQPGFAGWGEFNDTVDDPYELDLSLNAPRSYSGVLQAPYTNLETTYLANNNNYKANVVSIDAPFTPAELERILRYHDVDASSLPDRLVRLAPTTFLNNPPAVLPPPPGTPAMPPGASNARWPYYPELAQLPNLLTTDSFDLGSPSMIFTAPDHLFNLNSNPLTAGPMWNSHITQLVASRIRKENGPNYAPDLAISQILSPDLIGGERMNINRPLGNGNDDNGNGAVDEPGEFEQGWAVLYNNPNASYFSNYNGVSFDLNNDGVQDGQNPAGGSWSDTNGDGILDARDAPGILARQILARHLYVLMMLLKDDNFVVYADLNGDGYSYPANTPPPVSPATVPPQAAIDVAYYFAQWAVNIVDFRDQDAVMTPFEFDVFPFTDNDGNTNNGTWDVDGIISPYQTNVSPDDTQIYRGLVWGAERPELLITETMSAHDRRTRDTSLGTPAGFVDRPNNSPDKDFDQVRRPQGSLVVELFNPNPPLAVGNRIGGQAPNELYAQAGTDALNAPMFGVNLGMTAPPAQGQPNGAPVWRLAVLSRAAANSISGNNGAAQPRPLPERQPVLPRTAALPAPLLSVRPYGVAAYQDQFQPAPPFQPFQPFPKGESVIDRVAFFTQQPQQVNQIPQLDVEAWRQFYVKPGVASPVLPPNHYAVVGPGSFAPDPYLPATAPSGVAAMLGQRDFGQDAPAGGTSFPTSIKNTYYRRIVIDPTSNPSVTVHDDFNKAYAGAYAFPGDTKPPIPIPLAPLAFQGTTPSALTASANYASATRLLRFSITEPSIGYPVAVAPQLGGAQAWDENGYYTTPVGTPFDSPNATNFVAANDPNDFQRQIDIQDLNNNGTSADQTLVNYTIVYLQRLANPLQPFDANANPYIIVDQMWVDLTTYNSEKAAPQITGSKNQPEFASLGAAKFKFDTRQRTPVPATPPPAPAMTGPGPIQPAQSPLTYNNLWYPYGYPPQSGFISGPMSVGPLHSSTVGYLNSGYGYPLANTIFPNLGPYWRPSSQPQVPVTVGGQTPVVAQEYYGDPTIPFPWLNWNDRPYVSSKELMLVPLGSPASMLAEMTVNEWLMLQNVISNPYEPTNASTGSFPPFADFLPKGEFGHLPNVFHSPRFNALGQRINPTSGQNVASANLYRLLEYIQVPSRFTGTETWLPPAAMEQNATVPGTLPVHQLHPPFNRVSRFRDPGRVNINTVFDPFVWQGIMDTRQPYGLGLGVDWLWPLISGSRQGLVANPTSYSNFGIDNYGYPNPVANPAFPTIFPAPFRSYAGHTLVPLDVMRRQQVSNAEREIDATLLRPTSDSSQGVANPFPNIYPLLEYPGVPFNGSQASWWENQTQQQHTGLGTTTSVPASAEDPRQNPYFAYRAFRRMDNLLTTRSNVYAVWITVGYFEVTPAPTSDPQRSVKYPDGWVLGQELGSDTGDIQRHRAFYMYDRTIPVGFERGENHNAHRGILVERFIE